MLRGSRTSKIGAKFLLNYIDWSIFWQKFNEKYVYIYFGDKTWCMHNFKNRCIDSKIGIP